jgi:hypothetical protein
LYPPFLVRVPASSTLAAECEKAAAGNKDRLITFKAA